MTAVGESASPTEAPRMGRGPLCFVLMPFHAKVDSDGQRIDFAAVFREVIAPAIRDAGLEPLRADQEVAGGIFQKTMFERLVVCEFAVADLSTGNPNVYYELGVRHGLRPYSTVLLYRRGWALPLDVAHDSAVDYPVDGSGAPMEVAETCARLVARLRHARTAAVDSPVYQLVSGLPVHEVDHARIDSFRDRAARDEDVRLRLEEAHPAGRDAIRGVEEQLGPTAELDVMSVVNLVSAYRSAEAWSDVVRVASEASAPIARLEVVRQQRAMALNRVGRGAQAERVLRELLAERPSSETFGLLGRVFKDRWRSAQSPAQRRGFLREAIRAYVRGFETDFRDPYPGVNAVTLMFLDDPPDPRLPALLPVVRYAADRRLNSAGREPDYWDHATDLGLAVLEEDRERAHEALGCCLAAARESFAPKSTADDLELVRDAVVRRGADAGWIAELADELRRWSSPAA